MAPTTVLMRRGPSGTGFLRAAIRNRWARARKAGPPQSVLVEQQSVQRGGEQLRELGFAGPGEPRNQNDMGAATLGLCHPTSPIITANSSGETILTPSPSALIVLVESGSEDTSRFVLAETLPEDLPPFASISSVISVRP